MHAEKRRTATAMLGHDGRYLVGAPALSPPPGELLGRLAATAPTGPVLAGFDFPVGLPLAYAQRCGVTGFRDLLPELGRGVWQQFFEPAASLEQVDLRRPFFPAGNPPKGTATQAGLCSKIGVPDMNALRRRCDLSTGARPLAECMF